MEALRSAESFFTFFTGFMVSLTVSCEKPVNVKRSKNIKIKFFNYAISLTNLLPSSLSKAPSNCAIMPLMFFNSSVSEIGRVFIPF